MSDPRLEFRCDSCGKRLAAPLDRAGRLVKCPQCASKVVVPSAQPAAPEATADLGEAFFGSASTGVAESDDAEAPGIRSAAESDAFGFVAQEPIQLREPRRERFGDDRESSRKAVSSVRTEGKANLDEPSPILQLGAATPLANRSDPIHVPIVDEDTPTLRASSAPSRRAGDLVIPRSAVALWSLLALGAMGFAFAAGLLIGRFLWAPGVRIGSEIPRSPGASATGDR